MGYWDSGMVEFKMLYEQKMRVAGKEENANLNVTFSGLNQGSISRF